MKKLILILSFVALNVFAINCRDYMQYTFSDSEDFIVDSAYVANTAYDTIYYAPIKYYYTNNKLDSMIRCVGKNCWTYKTKYLKEKTDSTLQTTMFIDDWKSEKIIFLQNDSAITYDYSDEKEKLGTISDITTLVLRNDTLYENHKSTNEYEDIKSVITTPDPSDENVCNISETTTTPYGQQSGTKTYQEIITNTENGFVVSASNTDQKIFFVYINSTTSIHSKNRPAYIPEKAKHFDLLGRPANSKYIMKVSR
jgi:hypothetical protein